jgi:hypothetical protein
MLSLGIAKELGYTLSRLWAEVTPQELLLWSAYFAQLNEEQEVAIQKAKRH